MSTLPDAPSSALISAEALYKRLQGPSARIRLVDATYFVPPSPRNARQEFETCHLPGAVFFDIDAIAAPETDLPHMLPDTADFAEKVSALGIGNDDWVVAYDSHGLMSAARAWWMFRVFGHDQVQVLDGGLPRWLALDYPTASGWPTPEPACFQANFRPELVRNRQEVSALLSRGEASRIVDARGAARFRGEQPEPRAGLRSGHIPGSRNIPWESLVTGEFRQMLPAEKLQQAFESAKVPLSEPLIASCGSGVTACVAALALFELGKTDVAVYDGSWAEWGSESSGCPVATGTTLQAKSAG
jgi:thiosulfate/3-mercaptopyruvate sulfurtransferase